MGLITLETIGVAFAMFSAMPVPKIEWNERNMRYAMAAFPLIGAVIGASPKANVKRFEPKPGDIIVLLGGATGRDGCGGATGSSKAHTLESIEVCGAEVQKGNPPTERKIQRLFRDPGRYARRCC